MGAPLGIQRDGLPTSRRGRWWRVPSGAGSEDKGQDGFGMEWGGERQSEGRTEVCQDAGPTKRVFAFVLTRPATFAVAVSSALAITWVCGAPCNAPHGG